jgi:hypothetical protein
VLPRTGQQTAMDFECQDRRGNGHLEANLLWNTIEQVSRLYRRVHLQRGQNGFAH